MITNHNFFLEILKAVCLCVDWVPKLIQKIFPIMEQRCETEIVVDACNASYDWGVRVRGKVDVSVYYPCLVPSRTY